MLATGTSKQAAIDKLTAFIDMGRASAANVIDHVLNNQPDDKLVDASAMNFLAVPETEESTSADLVLEHTDKVARTFHKHALMQAATLAKIPTGYAENLRSTRWGTELLARTLNDHIHNNLGDKTYLLRSLKNDVRGFLSNRYRRIDSRPIVEAFAAEVQAAGAMPYKGVVTDTKIAIQAIFPNVYEPVPGEVVAYGLSLENSDFGNGAVSLRSHMLRIWCNNLMVTEETMREIHLGKRLTDDMVYSSTTYELDAQTVVSALRDIVKVQMLPEVIERKMAAITASAAVNLDKEQITSILKKMQTDGKITKAESELAGNAILIGGQDVVPEGTPTVWKLSNALSWVGGQSDNADRTLALTKLAGTMLQAA